MKKKKTWIFIGAFLLICILLFCVIQKNRNYNTITHTIELNENIMNAEQMKDEYLSVRIVPRGYDNNECTSWYHSYYLPNEPGEHHAVGTIYEMTITNLTKDIVSDWSATIYYPSNLMFNSGWNGDFELHQYVDGDEKTFLVKDSKFAVENLPLDYIFDHGVLLLPMHKGDYFKYTPSVSSCEIPLDPSHPDTGEYTSITTGFITYMPNGNIEDSYTFQKGKIEYKMRRSLFREPLFYVVCGAYWVWLMALIVLFIVHRKLKKVEKENQVMETMVHQFERDDLTGVYTRKAFLHYASELTDRNDRKKYGIAIVEINNYKITRSQYGDHLVNEYLMYLANYLKENFPNAYIGRFSESKFALITEVNEKNTIDPEVILDPEMIANSQMPNQVLKVALYVPIDRSVKISRNFDRVLMALSKIRDSYGQNVCYYEDEFESQILSDHKIKECMEAALADRQFRVYYQPKNNSQTGQVCGAEALVRWIHPEYGFMSPGQFIPIFEETGFITKLDTYVFEQVCLDMKGWMENNIKIVPVSINISRKDFYEEDWLLQRDQFAQDNGIDRAMLHLEVTESLYAEDEDQIKNGIQWLQNKGYKIEMDDFGSGYSSLGMLASMSLDVIKLDISFVRNIRMSKIVIESMIELAHRLHLTAIAEGVETQEQFETIQKLGCDIIQGFYFSKPLPKEEFEQYVIEDNNQDDMTNEIQGSPQNEH